MSRIFINSKGKTFYEASEGHIASCWLDGNQYWPYYQGQPDYETDTITKIGKVHYNKGKNYISVDFTEGLHIVNVGAEFDNSEKSSYYVKYENGEEHVYVGGPGYFDYSGNFTNVPPSCCQYFMKVGDSWTIQVTEC